MCDIQNNGKIQREFETRSTDDQPTIQWLPVVGSWTFLGVNMHFNEKLFMCDSCNFLVRVYPLCWGPLGLLGRPAAAGRFGRPGKSAAAAAITLSTQGVNEHQIESLQQTNYSWCILRCFMIYPWPMDG